MADENLNAELGEFWIANSDVRRAGSLSIVGGEPQLELIGCFPVDELPDESAGVGFPRYLPLNGEEHPVSCGLLRNGSAVTLVGLTGWSDAPVRIANGVSWAPMDMSGDARFVARYAVFDTPEATEPRFDRIEFSLPGLELLLERTPTWHPYKRVDQLHGIVPVVVPDLPDYDFTLRDGLRMSFCQRTAWGPDTPMSSVAGSRFALSAEDGTVSFSDIQDDLRALRALAELASNRHQPVLDVTGLRQESDSVRWDKYPIRSNLEGDTADSRRPLFSCSSIREMPRATTIDGFAAAIAEGDPGRADLLARWVSWFAWRPNAAAIDAYLSLLHRGSVADDEQLKSSVGILEHFADCAPSAADTPRVSSISADEAQDRRAVVDQLASIATECPAGAHEWALERLKAGVTGKGLSRKLRELIESIETTAGPILRVDRRTPRAEASCETPATTAKALAQARGGSSHGTGSSSLDICWRGDQARLLVVALVLSEVGATSGSLRELLLARSMTKRWWRAH